MKIPYCPGFLSLCKEVFSLILLQLGSTHDVFATLQSILEVVLGSYHCYSWQVAAIRSRQIYLWQLHLPNVYKQKTVGRIEDAKYLIYPLKAAPIFVLRGSSNISLLGMPFPHPIINDKNGWNPILSVLSTPQKRDWNSCRWGHRLQKTSSIFNLVLVLGEIGFLKIRLRIEVLCYSLSLLSTYTSSSTRQYLVFPVGG
jgi:hypothetical protein